MALAIAELPVGGGVLAISPMPGRGGAYAADLATLRAFAPALVLTMTKLDELASRQAGSLPQDLDRAGIGWAHLPIADFGAPDGTTAALWSDAAAQALAILAAGGRVLVHCMGGCGRSGMAALRLMVEAGEDPAAALARLRKVRPCAVEAPEQFAWAAAGQAGSGP